MNKLKTSLLVGAATIAVGGTLLAGSAMAANNPNSNQHDSLVDKIATKFNLNKDEVKQVFQQEHEEREAERQQKVSEYLQTKVDDKTITAEQKTLLENKLKEMHEQREANRTDLKELSRTERHEKMESQRAEFEQWAKDNNIPLDKLKLGLMAGHRGHGPHNHDQQ